MDEGKLRDAMKDYGSMVLRIAKAITGNKEDAEDVFSDTFFAAWHHKKPFNCPEHLKAWHIKVATNKAKNIKYTAYNRHKQELTDDILADEPYESEATVKVTEALMRLKPQDRAIIHLYHYERYTNEEIAQMLDIKESSVRSRISRVQSKLREILVRS